MRGKCKKRKEWKGWKRERRHFFKGRIKDRIKDFKEGIKVEEIKKLRGTGGEGFGEIVGKEKEKQREERW